MYDVPAAEGPIAVVGTSGAGKSALVTFLGEALGWRPVIEDATSNPYLVPYYRDRSRWCFHNEVWFLTKRLLQYQTALASGRDFLQERSFQEDRDVHAAYAHDTGVLSDADWATYCQLFEALTIGVPRPRLTLYVYATESTLRRRLSMRGEYGDSEYPIQFASGHSPYYERLIGEAVESVLRLDSDRLDWVSSGDDKRAVARQVGAALDNLHRAE